MYFDRKLFASLFFSYLRLLPKMLNASWCGHFDHGLREDSTMSLTLTWRHQIKDLIGWKPASFGGCLGWLIGFALAAWIIIFNLAVMFFKSCLWLVGFLPAICIMLLLSAQFSEPTPDRCLKQL